MEELNVGEKFVISDEQEGDLEVEVVARANVEGTDYIAVCFVEDLDSETDEDIDVFFLKLDEKGSSPVRNGYRI